MKKLSEGFNNQVWLLDPKTVAKVFDLGDPRAKRELKVLKKATNLMPAVNGIVYDDGYNYELLSMERLIVFEKRNFDHETRTEMLRQFRSDLKTLHAAGIAHGDIRRNADVQGGVWDNVIWTADRIRLIDAGNCVLADEATFEETVALDLRNLEAFCKYAMSD